VEGGPRAVWEALLEVVSPAGTVIVPTYYMSGGTIYSTCQDKDYCFDPRHHGTGLGALPAAFLELPDVKRSIHPTHSVSAIGKHAEYVTEAHHLASSIFGVGSPWQRCHELDGKVLGLGISMGPVTFYHLLEDSVLEAFPLPVRMRETFRLHCLGWDGQPLEVPVTPLDPAFMTRRIDHKSRDDLREYFWRDFELAGLLQVGRVGESRSWFVGSRRFYSHLLALMSDGVTIYALPEDLAARPPGGPPRISEGR
jgi:aminoglycoside N3'-acetyltransferase